MDTAKPASAGVADPTAHTQHILVVEDQGLVRAGMLALLKTAAPHSQLHEASCHDEACQLVDTLDLDLAFLDVSLGGERSGLDVLDYISANARFCRSIMLSASEDRDFVLRCIAKGASGYIPKSSTDDGVFRAALETVLNNGIYLPQSVFGARPIAQPVEQALVSPASLGLSARMCEALYYLCQGHSNKAIANIMNISEGTIRKNYVTDLLRFFGVARRTELMVEVARRNIQIPPPPDRRAQLTPRSTPPAR